MIRSASNADAASAIPIYIINLESAAARRESLLTSAAAHSVKVQVVAAVDARRLESEPGLRYDARAQLRRYGRELRPGEVGCYASHYRLWARVASDEAHAWAVIGEDDIEFAADFNDIVRAVRVFAQTQGLDFVRLFGVFDTRRIEVAPLDTRHRIVRFLRDPMGTQCYLISRCGARRLLESAAVWHGPVDHHLAQFWRHGLAPYAVYPYPVRETGDAHPSSIQTLRARMPRLARLTRELYRLWMDAHFSLLGALWWLRFRLGGRP